jgi:hypothetical protein
LFLFFQFGHRQGVVLIGGASQILQFSSLFDMDFYCSSSSEILEVTTSTVSTDEHTTNNLELATTPPFPDSPQRSVERKQGSKCIQRILAHKIYTHPSNFRVAFTSARGNSFVIRQGVFYLRLTRLAFALIWLQIATYLLGELMNPSLK